MAFYIVRCTAGNTRPRYFRSRRNAMKYARLINGTIEKSYTSGINFLDIRAEFEKTAQMIFLTACTIATFSLLILTC